jgi:hypothetical protein
VTCIVIMQLIFFIFHVIRYSIPRLPSRDCVTSFYWNMLKEPKKCLTVKFIQIIFLWNEAEHDSVYNLARCNQVESNLTARSPVCTSQETRYNSITETSLLMLFTEIIAVYCESRTKHIDVLFLAFFPCFEKLK